MQVQWIPYVPREAESVLSARALAQGAVQVAQEAREFGVTWMVQAMLNQDARDALALYQRALAGRWN